MACKYLHILTIYNMTVLCVRSKQQSVHMYITLVKVILHPTGWQLTCDFEEVRDNLCKKYAGKQIIMFDIFYCLLLPRAVCKL